MTLAFKNHTYNLINKFLNNKDVSTIINNYHRSLNSDSNVRTYLNLIKNKKITKKNQRMLNKKKFSEKSQQSIIHIVKVLNILQDYLTLMKNNKQCTEDMRKFYFILIFLKDQIKFNNTKTNHKSKTINDIQDIIDIIVDFLNQKSKLKKTNINKTSKKIKNLLTSTIKKNLAGGSKISKHQLGEEFLQALKQKIEENHSQDSDLKNLYSKFSEMHQKNILFNENPMKK